MTVNESAAIIAVLQACYPRYYRGLTKDEYKNMVILWTDLFADFDYQRVKAGVQAYLANDKNGFPPSPGQVIAMIRTAETNNDIGGLEAWALVRKAVQNSYYHADEEYERLPEAVKKAVGSSANLRAMAMMDIATFESVEQSHFIRTYNAVVMRKNAVNSIPANVRDMLSDDGGRKELND